MKKVISIKEKEDRNRFVLPIEFGEEFSDDEKIKILQSYFQAMVDALLANKTEDKFMEGIKESWKSEGYTVMQLVSRTFTYRWNILGPLPEMMMHSASSLLKENSGWPPNLAAALIFCINAIEISVNNILIDRFNTINRPDKSKLVEDDRGLSLEDKFTWLLNDAFGASLKNENILWVWFLDIKNMRNKIVHFKKDSDGTDITLNNQDGTPRKKLDEAFTSEAIRHTNEILDFLRVLSKDK